MSESMLCVYCGQQKHSDGFPNRAYAQCWNCMWIEHVRAKHPRIIRAVRKSVEKRAKTRRARDAQSEAEELLRHAVGDEAALLVGAEQARAARGHEKPADDGSKP